MKLQRQKLRAGKTILTCGSFWGGILVYLCWGGGRCLWTCLSLVHAKAQKAAFPSIFLLYHLHVVPKCLIFPAKCCKNLSFDLTDGKDLLAPPEATHQIPFFSSMGFQGLLDFFDQTCSSSVTHMTS